jgi:transcriptional regulator with XRE-family HTH domain
MEHKVIHEELKILRKIREKKKMTQKEVAEESECHQSFYSKVERGEIDISFKKLKPMLTALGAKIIIKG